MVENPSGKCLTQLSSSEILTQNQHPTLKLAKKLTNKKGLNEEPFRNLYPPDGHHIYS